MIYILIAFLILALYKVGEQAKELEGLCNERNDLRIANLTLKQQVKHRDENVWQSMEIVPRGYVPGVSPTHTCNASDRPGVEL